MLSSGARTTTRARMSTRNLANAVEVPESLPNHVTTTVFTLIPSARNQLPCYVVLGRLGSTGVPHWTFGRSPVPANPSSRPSIY